MSSCPEQHSFAHRLAEAIAATGTVLCVGVDPHPGLMPAAFGGTEQPAGSAPAVQHLRAFTTCVIEAAAGRVPAIKPQAAFFERHGPGGMQILAEAAKHARERGLLVIMDAKRGDIGSTAQAYAEAWLGPQALFASDALTVNPYLGFDSLEPFMSRAEDTKSGLFILVRTSNKGSADLQQLEAEGKSVWAHLAAGLAPYIDRLIDRPSGLSSLGIVVGATGPDEARAVRQMLPAAPFLIPGYGAQGASADDALAGLITDAQTKRYTGGLVNASRAITHGQAVQDARTADEAKQAMTAAIEAAAKDLSAGKA